MAARPSSATKAILSIYIAGYFIFWLLAAVTTWSTLPFMRWWAYVAFQLVYAAFWPILLLLTLLGLRW